jgi:hypothetical protein
VIDEFEALDEPEQADVIALLRATLAGDELRVYQILAPLVMLDAFGLTVAVLLEMLAQVWPGGAPGIDEHLAHVQQSVGRS